MKFIAGKKLSDNGALRQIMIWMLFLLILAMGLSLSVKGIEYGLNPSEWCNTVLGNEVEFIDPLGFKNLLLAVHTDLFGLIITLILIASLYMRSARSIVVKSTFLSLVLSALLLYPAGLLLSPISGSIAVTIGIGGFILFHLLIIATSTDLLVLLFRRKI